MCDSFMNACLTPIIKEKVTFKLIAIIKIFNICLIKIQQSTIFVSLERLKQTRYYKII